MKKHDYNPDVLNCVANLSNDEVLTPPALANKMLDVLPAELFSNPKTTFLDPFSKSGVFLREIVKRLDKGLASQIPDRQERIDHIMHKQVFGIACTELTSLLSRRTLYCSKFANGKHSVSKFDDEQGNLRYEALKHTWVGGKCKYCGASQEVYDRGDQAEQYAYQFIHTDNPKSIYKNMNFDVIIGNPPYQLTTSGSVESQSLPIYQKFVEQSKKLNPRYLTMIIPSRWMIGGFGLDKFREDMINDKRIHILHDFLESGECFDGVSIPGGVCYFLWDRSSDKECYIYTHKGDNIIAESTRYLKEKGVNTFIRFNEGVNILNKVKKLKEKSFSDLVSPRDPFGLNYYENGSERMFKLFKYNKTDNDLPIYYNGWQSKGIAYADKKYIQSRADAVNKYKVFISKANGAASSKIPYSVISKPFVGGVNTICNMTYLMVGPFDDENEAINVAKYMSTKFFRFLVSLLKSTQNALKQVYSFVPIQDFSHPWTDEMLYKKYDLTQEEIDFIESMIKPME